MNNPLKLIDFCLIRHATSRNGYRYSQVFVVALAFVISDMAQSPSILHRQRQPLRTQKLPCTQVSSVQSMSLNRPIHRGHISGAKIIKKVHTYHI